MSVPDILIDIPAHNGSEVKTFHFSTGRGCVTGEEGTENLVVNPNMDTDINNWTVSNGTTANGTLTRRTDDGVFGSTCLEYTLSTLGSWQVFYNWFTTGKTAPYFDTSKQYTLSFYVKLVSGSLVNFWAGIADNSGLNKVIPSWFYLDAYNTPGIWQRVVITFTPAISGAAPVIYFGCGSNVSSRTIRICGVQVEQKDHATPFVSGSRPDTLQYYEPRVLNPGSIRMMLFAEGTTSGASETGYGVVSLVNSDGALDSFLDYGIAGRTMIIRKILAGVTLFTMSCAMEQPAATLTEVSIRVKDLQMVLNQPLQSNTYGGTNSAPNGIDGEIDIKGKPKPLVFGYAPNITPVQVNPRKLIYQGNDGPVNDFPAVYDKGVSLSRGTDYTNQADMEANAPVPGQYRAWTSGGCFRLGSSPSGEVTCDVIEGNTAADRTRAQITKRILLKKLTAGDLNNSSFDELDSILSAEVGIYISDNRSINSVLDDVLSPGCWRNFDPATGKLSVGRLGVPSGVPALSLTSAEILSIDRKATNDESRGLPVYKVTVNYQKNWTVQTPDQLAGSVPFGALQSVTLPIANINSIAYGNGMFVGVGSGSNNTRNVITSPDGVVWTVRSNALPTSIPWSLVIYGGGTFLAFNGNSSNVAATSPDGITWTSRTLPWDGFVIRGGYGGGKFIIFPLVDDTSLATSPDGITWTSRTLPVSDTYQALAYGNSTFVLTGTGTNVLTSTDGATWTARTMPSSASSWEGTFFGGSVFVSHSWSSSTIATSLDGITWTQRTLPASISLMKAGYGDGVFVMALNISTFLISEDGIVWNQRSSASSSNWVGVTFGCGSFVILGQSTNSNLLDIVSPTGSHWKSLQYRSVIDSDSSVLTVHPDARAITINTALINFSDAIAEATYELDLRKVRRDLLAIKCKRGSFITLPALGSVIQLIYPRFGYDSGKLFIFLGAELLLGTDDITLYIWG